VIEARTAIETVGTSGRHLSPLSFTSSARTHVGHVRAKNEDAFLDRSNDGLWVVADGMGGYDDGAIASGLIVQALSQIEEFSSAFAFQEAVCSTLMRVNADLVMRASLRPGKVMGSTVVSLLAYERHYSCIWAGDSRAYLLRNGALKRLSHDHSLLQELIDLKKLAPTDPHCRSVSNIITRAVGATPELKLASVHGDIQSGDRFLLCSDGLTGLVSDDEIAHALKGPSLSRAVDQLLDKTLAEGAPDNVTLLAISAVER
jgi:serine/threonine protein phosphatase PrpC